MATLPTNGSNSSSPSSKSVMSPWLSSTPAGAVPVVYGTGGVTVDFALVSYVEDGGALAAAAVLNALAGNVPITAQTLVDTATGSAQVITYWAPGIFDPLLNGSFQTLGVDIGLTLNSQSQSTVPFTFKVDLVVSGAVPATSVALPDASQTLTGRMSVDSVSGFQQYVRTLFYQKRSSFTGSAAPTITPPNSNALVTQDGRMLYFPQFRYHDPTAITGAVAGLTGSILNESFVEYADDVQGIQVSVSGIQSGVPISITPIVAGRSGALAQAYRRLKTAGLFDIPPIASVNLSGPLNIS